MSYHDDLYTVRYFFGVLIPVLLLVAAVGSFVYAHSFIPFIGGRFLPREIFGFNAYLTGVGYVASAVFSFAASFTPFKRRYEKAALFLLCASFIVVACLFGYLFFATATLPNHN